MNIKREKDEIVIRLPMWQDSHDALGEVCGQVNNLWGIIAGEEQGIYQANDLGYKGDVQVGMPLVLTYLENDKFKKLCKDLDISVVEYPVCKKCEKVIYGSYTYKDGPIHLECNN